MREVLLTEICNPKQWKTITSSELEDEGFPVFGANGVIGYYHNYNHEEATILITCRGATCGTLNICSQKSYVTGNAMALDDLDE
jgi:type I restriction enzyme S subunit